MNLKYDQVVGTGGIGVGMLFQSNINETLGRSESRLVELSSAKDYCKLHIVFHYIAAILSQSLAVYPIGYVGDDANGKRLLAEMQEVGMDLTYIHVDEELPTDISICLQYPDKEGCNFTTANGASQKVNIEYVHKCIEQLVVNNYSIVAAIPEVSVQSRIAMLRRGHEKGAFCALSMTVSEVDAFKEADIFSLCDLLAVNEEEAIAITGSQTLPQQVIKDLYECVKDYNPNMLLLVTCGKLGAYSVSNGNVEYIPNMSVQVVNTTGAGDACLGGVLAAIAMGIPFQKGISDSRFGQTPLASAVELGTLCAGMAIECNDSIAKHVHYKSILERIKKEGWDMRYGL